MAIQDEEYPKKSEGLESSLEQGPVHGAIA